jgi:hypothetical protein
LFIHMGCEERKIPAAGEIFFLTSAFIELDWTGVCWDADFRREGNKWRLYDFRGTRWQDVKDQFQRTYLANAYRVLLTRARQGMVVFVPKGDEKDYTRPPRFYDETYEFLASCGIGQL